MTRIWFLIGLELIVWFLALENVRLFFRRIKSRSKVKLLDITVDDKASFTTNIENLCTTARNRLLALVRIRKFLSLGQGKRLADAYIISTSRYCPLIWIFCKKAANNLINNTHKYRLRLLYEMEDTSFEDLSIKDSS